MATSFDSFKTPSMSAASSNLTLGCSGKNYFNPPLSPYEHAKNKLQNFHGRVLRTFSELPQKGKLKEIARRCIIVTGIPFVYLVLTWKLMRANKLSLASTTVTLPPVITKAAAILPATSQPAITPDLTMTSQTDYDSHPIHANLDAELLRLKENGVLSSKIEKQIDMAIFLKSSSYPPNQAKLKLQKVLIAQAFELKKAHEQDNIVLTHGQSSLWYVISQLIKVCVKQYDKDAVVPPDFEFLRSTRLQPANNAIGYRQVLESGNVNDHNQEIRSSMMSLDVYSLAIADGESALSLFFNNQSMMSTLNRNAIKDVSETILRDYLPKTINAEKITECAEKIQNLAKKINTLCGQLFVICIPKTLVIGTLDNVGFLAHPLGKPCNCHPHTDPVFIITKLQNGELTPETRCHTNVAPQFRLMTNMIAPNVVTKSFLLSPLSPKQKMDIYKEISDAVAAIA